MFWTLLMKITAAVAGTRLGLHVRLADFVLGHDRYWKGYFDGLNARQRAHEDYLELQKHIE